MEKINVFYHDKLVGTLALSKDEDIYFQYDKGWIKNGFSISPLKLPLSNTLYKANRQNELGLFGVFLDSLPDAWGKLLFDKYIKNKYKDNTFNGLDYLSFIGTSGMGALEYKPANNDNEYQDADVDLDLIQKEANNLLDSKEIKNIDNLYHLGSSIGGAKPKILIKLDEKDYIVKFSSKYDDENISKIEYEYSLLAKECGINVPNVKLIKTNKNSYFAIERFDRLNNTKIHMISVAALFDIDFNTSFVDYIDLIKLTDVLTRNKEDIIEMYRRMVFNVVFNNLDDHIKNFSFLYNEAEHKYRLSPAYDLTNSKTFYNEHTTSVNKKSINIDDEDMLEVARKTNIKPDIAINIIKKIRTIHNKLK